MSKVLLFLLLIAFNRPILAATITSNGTGGGNWNLGTSWIGGTAPAPGDDVIISAGDAITVTASANCRSITIQDNASSLTVNNSVTLSLSNNLVLLATSNANAITLTNNGTISGIGSFEARDKVFSDFTVNILGSGTINVLSRVLWLAQGSNFNSTISNNILTPAADIRFLCYSAANMNVTLEDSISCRRFELYAFGNTNDIQINATNTNFRLRTQWIREYRRGGVFNGGNSGSIVYLANNFLTHGTNVTYNDLIVQSNLTLSAAMVLNVNGTMQIETGRTFATNGNNFSLPGNLHVDGILSMNTGDQFTFNSTGAAAQTISGTGSLNFTNLIMNCSNAAGGVTVNSPIEISENLVCTDGTFTTNNNVSMRSNASGTANIGAIGASASIVGEIEVNKWFAGMNNVADWVYFHMPGIPENLNVINAGVNPRGFFTFGYPNSNSPATLTYRSTYRYDETAAAAASGTAAQRFEAGWTAATNANTETFDPSSAWIFLLGGSIGVGAKDTYHIRESIQPFNAGAVFAGSGSNANTWTGWNLFGNPYASAVNVANSMMTAIQGNAFIVYERTSGYTALTAGDILPAFQSFFVQVQNGTNQVTFAQSDKSTNHTTQIYKKIKHADRMDIHLTRDSGSFQAHAYLRFDANGAIGFDGGDLYQLRNGWPRPNVALIEQDSLPFMIDNIPTNFDDLHIPIRVEASESDWHTLDFENIPDRSACYLLEDLETGDMIDLSSQSSYRFYMADTTNAPRFVLHISKGVKDARAEAASCFGFDDGFAVAELNPNKSFDVTWLDNDGNVVKQAFGVNGNDSLIGVPAGDYSIQLTANTGDCAYMEEFVSIFEPVEVLPDFEPSNITPNVWANEAVEFNNQSEGATNFAWDFGDGSALSIDVNPSHSFSEAGAYVVSLKASNGNAECDATKMAVVKAVNQAPAGLAEAVVSPLTVLNKGGKYFLHLEGIEEGSYKVQVTNLLGQSVSNEEWNLGQEMSFELGLPTQGIYIVNVSAENFNESIKLSSQSK